MSRSMSKSKEVATPTSVAGRKTLYALTAFTAAVIVFGIYSSLENLSRPKPGSTAPVAATGALVSAAPFFDFGKISMAAGNVSHRYWISNSGAVPLSLTRISTSCMCTVATLITPAGRKGPFGMAGHGVTSRIAERLAPGETAQVEIVFDPAAHGPAGIGQTDRIVTIGNDGGPPVELRFSALVTP